jgi:hypothetical protein
MTRPFVFGIITALAISSLPPEASAQLPPPTVEGTTAQTVAPAQTERDPHRQLARARQQLQAVSTKALSADGKKKLAQLQADFELLATNYERRSQTAPDSTATSGARSRAEVVDWKLQFDAVERDLVAILGAGALISDTPAVAGTSGVAATTTPAEVSGTPQPVAAQSSQPAPTPAEVAQMPPSQQTGTAQPSTQPAAPSTQAAGAIGTQAGGAGVMTATTQQAGLVGIAAASEIGVKNLDPGVRSQLEAMRKSVEMFYDATTSLQRP